MFSNHDIMLWKINHENSKKLINFLADKHFIIIYGEKPAISQMPIHRYKIMRNSLVDNLQV